MKEKVDSSILRVILENSEEDVNPSCVHGPTILFERIPKSNNFDNGDVKRKSIQFYACSAFRDRKKCNFYQMKSEKKNSISKTSKLKAFDVKFVKNPTAFCKTCQILLQFVENHERHDLIRSQFSTPSKLLSVLDDSKSQAQFHFSCESTLVMVKAVLSQDPSLVLCIGTPSIFEEISKNHPNKKVLLLDIDQRYAMFTENFCHFNMFNHYFFNENSLSKYKSEIASNHNSVAVITDPPFGGRPELISNTLKKIKEDFKPNNFTAFWIFPYYMEPQIVHNPSNLKFQMSDYQVTYDQKSQYKQGHQFQGRRKLGSPVRIFTTMSLSFLDLSHLENYRLCQTCSKFVILTNRHCHECGFCTAKNGGFYKHCYECRKCVKRSWSHCKKCRRCTLPNHDQCALQKLI